MSSAFKSRTTRFKAPVPKVPGPGHYKVDDHLLIKGGSALTFAKGKYGRGVSPGVAIPTTPLKGEFKVPGSSTRSRSHCRRTMFTAPRPVYARSASRGSSKSSRGKSITRRLSMSCSISQKELDEKVAMIEKLNKELNGIESQRCADKKKIIAAAKELHEQMKTAEEFMDYQTPWIMYVDKQSKCAYFYNGLTGDTTWEEPENYLTHESAADFDIENKENISQQPSVESTEGEDKKPTFPRRSRVLSNDVQEANALDYLLMKLAAFRRWSGARVGSLNESLKNARAETKEVKESLTAELKDAAEVLKMNLEKDLQAARDLALDQIGKLQSSLADRDLIIQEQAQVITSLSEELEDAEADVQKDQARIQAAVEALEATEEKLIWADCNRKQMILDLGAARANIKSYKASVEKSATVLQSTEGKLKIALDNKACLLARIADIEEKAKVALQIELEKSSKLQADIDSERSRAQILKERLIYVMDTASSLTKQLEAAHSKLKAMNQAVIHATAREEELLSKAASEQARVEDEKKTLIAQNKELSIKFAEEEAKVIRLREESKDVQLELERSVAFTRGALDEANRELSVSMEESKTLAMKLAENQKTQVQLEEKISSAVGDLKVSRGQLTAALADNDTLSLKLAAVEGVVVEKKGVIKETEEMLHSATAQLKSSQEKLNTFSSQNRELSVKLADAENTQAQLENTISVAVEDLHMANTELKTALADNDTLSLKLTATEGLVVQKEGVIKETEEKLNSTRAQLKATQEKLDTTSGLNHELSAKLANSKTLHLELKEKMASTSADLEALRTEFFTTKAERNDLCLKLSQAQKTQLELEKNVLATTEDLDATREALSDALGKNKELSVKLGDTEKAQRELDDKLSATRGDLKATREELSKALVDSKALSDQLTDAQKTKFELVNKIFATSGDLEATREDLSNALDNNKALSHKLADSKKIQFELGNKISTAIEDLEGTRVVLSNALTNNKALSNKLDDVKKTQSELENKISVTNEDLQITREQLSNALGDSKELSNKLADAEKTECDLIEKISVASKDLKSTKKELSVALAHSETLSVKLVDAEGAMKCIQAELGRKSKALESSESKLKISEATRENLEIQLEELKSTLEQSQSDYQEKLSCFTKDLKHAGAIEQELSYQITTVAKRNEALRVRLAKEEKTRKELEEENASNTGELGALQEELVHSVDERKTLGVKLGRIEAKYGDMVEQREELWKQLQSEQANVISLRQELSKARGASAASEEKSRAAARSARKAIEAAKARMVTYKAQLADTSKAMELLRKRVSSNEQQVSSLTVALKKARTEGQRLACELVASNKARDPENNVSITKVRAMKAEHTAQIDQHKRRCDSLSRRVVDMEKLVRQKVAEQQVMRRRERKASAERIGKLEEMLKKARRASFARPAPLVRKPPVPRRHSLSANHDNMIKVRYEAAKEENKKLKNSVVANEKQVRTAARQMAELKNKVAKLKKQKGAQSEMLERLTIVLENLAQEQSEVENHDSEITEKARMLIEENVELKMKLEEESQGPHHAIQELEKLREENASLVEHRNPNQRIKLHQKIKLENHRLQLENQALRKQMQKLALKNKLGMKENTHSGSVHITTPAKSLTKRLSLGVLGKKDSQILRRLSVGNLRI